MRDEPGKRAPSEDRRPVGLYSVFLDGPLADVQTWLQEDGRLGRRPTQIEAIEYLYRHWRQSKAEGRL